MNNTFNEQEFEELKNKLRKTETRCCTAEITEVTIEYDNPGYFSEIRRAVDKDRRGEIVFALIRPNGKVITVRSEVYPANIFRIPTGGINYNEDILDAVYREVKEELGLTFNILEFSGVIKITFKFGYEKVSFYSYVFILEETGGRLLEDALEDEVNEVLEADENQLDEIIEKLIAIEKDWRDWGRFRAVTTGYVRDRIGKIKK